MMSSPRGPGPSTEPADGVQVEMDDGHVVGIAQSRSIERCGHGSVARCPVRPSVPAQMWAGRSRCCVTVRRVRERACVRACVRAYVRVYVWANGRVGR